MCVGVWGSPVRRRVACVLSGLGVGISIAQSVYACVLVCICVCVWGGKCASGLCTSENPH